MCYLQIVLEGMKKNKEWKLLQYIIIYQQIIYSRNSMLGHPVFCIKSCFITETNKAFILDIICLLLHYSWQFLQQINIYQHRIYIRNSMLAHPVFFTNIFSWY